MKHAALFLLVMILILSACSKADSSLRIGIIKPSIDHLPLSYALSKGWLDAGQYKCIPFSSGWEVQEALIAGRIDVAIIPFTYVWNAASKGYPIRTISFFERETDAIVVQREVHNPQQLNGKRIGLLKGSTLDVLWQDYAAENGIEAEEVYFRSPNEAISALQKKELEAAVLYVPVVNKLVDKFNVLHWFGDTYGAHPCCDLAVNKQQIDNAKEKLLRQLYSNLEQAISQIDFQSKDMQLFIAQNYGTTDAETIEALKHTVFKMGLQQSGIDFQARMAAISIASKYLDKIPPISEVYWDTYAK
ncbi:MAG: ABC transporter substrate-binding protein [Candidatus Cloacimonetes bacterium]|nr:ABC transporter substrate-binding protein [Candidatus Cloacimonadota bacterium]